MNMNERRTIKIEPYTIDELQKMVNDWNIDQRVCFLVYSNYFKYPLKHYKDIKEEFIKNCIIHFLVRKFPYQLVGNPQEEIIRKSYQIKQQYRKIYIQGTFKSDFSFYFLIILITKLISEFIQHRYSQIKIDNHMESQIFITLISTMLGIQLGHQSYKVQKNKYILKKTHVKHNQSLNIKQNYEELGATKKRIAMLYDRKDEAKFQLLSQEKKMGKLSDNCFQSQLRQNLYVQPLPKIQKKQYTLTEVQFSNQSFTQVQQYLNSFSNVERMFNNKYLIMNQMSDSTMCKVSPLKNSKISYTPQYCSSLYKLKANRQGQNHEQSKKIDSIKVQTNNDKQQSKRSSKKWQRVISEMKENIEQNSKCKLKLNFHSRLCKEEDYSMRKSINQKESNHLFPFVQKPQRTQKISTQIQKNDKENFNANQEVRIQQKKTQTQRRPSNLRISAKKLGEFYSQFLSSCAVRERLSKCEIPPILSKH